MPHSAGSVYSAAAGSAPHIIPLHVPPPPMSQLALPPYILPPMGSPMGPCVFHGNTAAMTLPDRRERRRSRKHQRHMSAGQAVPYPTDAMLEPLDETTVAEAVQRAAVAAARRQRHPNALSEEEMERSYTGLDRAIAEQFIVEVMEKHQHDDQEEEEARRRVSTVSSSGRLSCSQRINHALEDETF
ncbi:hypothetical protein B566_EDAN009864 [Ephemera danica]|nr:hypothetical protein B566_EDAN009864 [Ephemera danica]